MNSGRESARSDNPNEGSDGELNREVLDAEAGGVLRARILCTLARAMLMRGVSHGLEEIFDRASDLSRRLLEEAADARDGKSRRHERAVEALARTRDSAEEGSRLLARYKELVTKHDTSSFGKKEAMKVLDEAIDIAPDNVDWHVRKLDHLVRKRRWFSVANHCERHAASRSRLDGIFVGDLRGADPFVPNIPPLRELSDRFFADAGRSSTPPVHLRTLGPAGARDAAFRLPPEMLPRYLRSLRLEMRFDDAHSALSALEEYDAGVDGTAQVCDPSELRRERAKLDETVRLKEMGDAQRGEGFHDQAIKLYGECLAVDAGTGESGGGGPGPGILKRQSSWPAASFASNAGGRLHAVLHDLRASCLVSLDKLDSAAAESGRALDVHSMYVGALLRRARVHAALGDVAGAKADFTRFIVLVEGARLHPYPPPNQGAACHFDMPSEVTDGQLEEVQREMEGLGIKGPAGRRGGRGRRGSLNPLRNLSLCGKKKAAGQVADGMVPGDGGGAAGTRRTARWPMGGGNFSRKRGGTSGAGRRSSPAGTAAPNAKPPPSERKSRPRGRSRRVSFSLSPGRIKRNRKVEGPDDPDGEAADGDDSAGDDEDGGGELAKHNDDADDWLVDPPDGVVPDPSVDYYAVLGVDASDGLWNGSDDEIRKACVNMAREFHPDRSDGSEGAAARFEEIRIAYAVLGDEGRRREYDEARASRQQPDP